MIHDDPTETNPYVIARLDQLRRFLASRGVPETAYRLAPASRSITGDADAHAIIQAEYGDERFRSGSPGATIRWPTPSGAVEVRTTVSQAQFLIAFAFDRPENLALLTGLNATIDASAAAAALGLDQDVLKRGVAQYMPGEYVAPDGRGWALFLVEPYGEVVILADADRPAPLLQTLAASHLLEQQNLAGRMAKSLVPFGER
ncbi:hypothetical protein [Sphingomonas yabuuchiae]|uniref:hypothetical protein n=1 Tax=Sphingomonas yabuuchiae TaxID=172044 RepID=UPI003D963621